ncbi:MULTISPECIES: Y-family DNA polymerase [Hyphomonas]|nr:MULTISPECIES: DNA polymerase Y family protein [Hyphomonas]
MRRYLSVWFPEWPLDRLRRARRHPTAPSHTGNPDKLRPFILHETSPHGLVVAIANKAAQAAGIHAGLRFTDARATLPDLASEEIDRENDARALTALAGWMVRFSPLVGVDGIDGLILETTGCDHLFGGESGMAAELSAKLAHAGYGHKIAIAGTVGAAWALTHATVEMGKPVILANGDERTGLADLPTRALRLSESSQILLRRFGLTRIRQLYDIDRKALTRRFNSRQSADAVRLRLDQALGIRPEPFTPFRPPPDYSTRLPCPEPLTDGAGISAGLSRLTEELCEHLSASGVGAQSFLLQAFRSDGEIARIRVNAARPVRKPEHVMRLFGEKTDAVDPGFGIDLLLLEAFRTGEMATGSRLISGGFSQADVDEDALAALADRVNARLGEGVVTVTIPEAHHPPQAAERTVPFSGQNLAGAARPYNLPGLRPARLFERAERVEVIAEVPDGPPQRFIWRRKVRRVIRADGPERIAPEWWTYLPPRPEETVSLPRARDYYRVEDEDGRRYWVFREGLYGDGRGESPDWFVQGLFS